MLGLGLGSSRFTWGFKPAFVIWAMQAHEPNMEAENRPCNDHGSLKVGHLVKGMNEQEASVRQPHP